MYEGETETGGCGEETGDVEMGTTTTTGTMGTTTSTMGTTTTSAGEDLMATFFADVQRVKTNMGSIRASLVELFDGDFFLFFLSRHVTWASSNIVSAILSGMFMRLNTRLTVLTE